VQVIFLDYETYYDKDYSLRKMTPVEYVLDKRFECIGCAVKEGVNGEAYWVDGADLPLFFADLDPKQTILVTHNALFDMCITAWRYNFMPTMMIDTLGIARAALSYKLRSLSLESVAKALGLGVKGGTVHKVIGMHAGDIKRAGLYNEYIEYSINDVELCAGIYKRLVQEQSYPPGELVLMDMVLRCAIQPQFLIDKSILTLHLQNIRAQKDALMETVAAGGVSKEDLMSNDKFAEALRNVGVEPPTKISQVTGKEAYAFAKTDPQFIELEEHDNPQVQMLVAARLGHKSTLEETRTERFLNIANLTWPNGAQGWMPMPLRYSGAHTHRLSGDWSLNVQNMPRGGALRRALIAPEGKVILAADASQIEARVVAWLCKQQDLVDQFARGEDVYSSFASKVFGRPIDKKKDPAERFIGKTAILGLGYGLGWQKFQKTVKLQSKAQTGQTIDLSDADTLKIVNTYRDGYANIRSMWTILNRSIDFLKSGAPFDFGPCEWGIERVRLPSGLSLHYHNLTSTPDGWQYEHGGRTKRLYGGAFLENITQALARIVVMDAALRLRKRFKGLGVQLALQVHDELVYVVPSDHAGLCMRVALEEMGRRPSWAPDLPLAAEAGIGISYGEAK